MKILFALALTLLTSTASAQNALVQVKVVYDKADIASSAVAPIFIQKLAAQPKFFTVVDGSERNMAIITDCYKGSANEPFSCFYTASKWLGPNEAFLGGAIVVKNSAEDAANALFASILQDVIERWNSTDRKMQITELETCLMLTETSCAVPKSLIPELKIKTINLSQYIRNGSLKP